MKKQYIAAGTVLTIWVILIASILSACTSVQTTPTPSEIISPSPSPIPGVSGSITFKCSNCDAREAKIFEQVNVLADQVVQSQCFADHFIKPEYRSQLIQTNGLSRQGVVSLIQGTKIVVPVEMYYDKGNVAGYTNPSTPVVFLNRYFRTQWDYDNGYWGVCAEVSNGVHEATHKAPMSFDHDFNNTSRRPYSVPYSANFAVDACCDVFLKKLLAK